MNIPPFYLFFENIKIKESEFINLTYCKSLVQIRRFGTMQRFQKDQEEVVASVPLSGAGQKSYRGNSIKYFCFLVIASINSFSLKLPNYLIFFCGE